MFYVMRIVDVDEGAVFGELLLFSMEDATETSEANITAFIDFLDNLIYHDSNLVVNIDEIRKIAKKHCCKYNLTVFPIANEYDLNVR